MSMSPPSPPLGRRAVLGSLLATPVAAGALAGGYQSRAEATAATVPADETHITVRGRAYRADPDGTALVTGDGRRWSPDGIITPLHFGDKSEDDTAIIQAAVDYAAVLGSDGAWDSSTAGAFPRQVIVTGQSELYQVSRPIQLRRGNRNNTIRDFSIRAVGPDWAQDGGKGHVGDVAYFPARSDFIFVCRSRATHVLFENLKLNCNDRCGGIAARSRTRVVNCFIKKCAGVGVLAGSGDVWVDRCIIRQYDQNDVEYYAPENFTGIGVLCDDSDLRLTHSTLSWLAECVRIEGTNCNVAHCHIFNGCRGYLGRYKKNKGEEETRGEAMNAALSAYFGRRIDDEVDFAPRPYHAGIVVASVDSVDNSFDSVYFDNCHNELYGGGAHFNEPKLGCKPNSTLWTAPVDYWFGVYPGKEGEPARFVLDEVEIFVEARPKRLAAFLPNPETGAGWGDDYDRLNRAGYNLATSDWGNRFRLDVPVMHAVSTRRDGVPAVTYASAGQGAYIGFADAGAQRAETFGGDREPLVAWAPGQNFRYATRCFWKDNVYESLSRGRKKTSGKTPPTHLSGVASDGKITWAFLGTRDAVPVRVGARGNDAHLSAPAGQVVIDAAEGLSLPVTEGGTTWLTVSSPADATRFQIAFDDAAGQIRFYVGGDLKGAF